MVLCLSTCVTNCGSQVLPERRALSTATTSTNSTIRPDLATVVADKEDFVSSRSGWCTQVFVILSRTVRRAVVQLQESCRHGEGLQPTAELAGATVRLDTFAGLDARSELGSRTPGLAVVGSG